ncbi:family 20 glycosylhydrolase [Saccharicrinis aurantiacus]|uniref:family 20 glycosylhydrolase n=1 Tax=Saccharicrinis aurantiacus TaxID=1849719 RepID=UPI002492BAAA|nr:family 20 glycosylhydrolase [Saccharicrinis aurantiacus]
MIILNHRFLQFVSIILLTIVFVGCSNNSKKDQAISLVPYPNSLEIEEGLFESKTVNINYSKAPEYKDIIELFIPKIGEFLTIDEEASDGSINIIVDEKLQKEAYQLNIQGDQISIVAGNKNGFIYAFTTLLQLFDQYAAEDVAIPCMHINDSPQYSWRGMHLDVSRHFFDITFVKKMLDAMALHKLNVFHWHLTDDQGWRIEINKYPGLTEKGAWREETIIGHMAEHPKKYDGVKYGGYYTQEEIKEVVAYADELGIMVLPEIEMPGHAVAAARAFPNLTCTGKPQPFNEWGVSDDVFCAGNENTFHFLQDVIDEVIELFPSEYIHVGGDECPKTKWETCKKCQARMKKEGLHDEMELQSYFIKRMEKYISSKGKKLIGWDEILEGGLAEGATVMSWQGVSGGVEAASHGHDVIICPNAEVYLDHYQSNYNEPLAIAGLTTMESIYNWSPMPDSLDAKYKHHVLGAQANVWTEYMPASEQVEYMVFPRLSALSEMLWTNDEVQNFDAFTARMNQHYKRLDALNLNYRIPYPEGLLPVDVLTPVTNNVELHVPIDDAQIYYTTDGSDPKKSGKRYVNELVFSDDKRNAIEFKYATKMPNGRWSNLASSLIYNNDRFKSYTEAVETGVLSKVKVGEFSSTQISFEEWNHTRIQDGIRVSKKAPKNFFGEELYGYIKVPESGVYTFTLSSNDGSKLWIHDREIIDNDGFSYGRTREGKVALEAGMHPFKIIHFVAKYGSNLELTATAPDGTIINFDGKNVYH